jgi:hypothetical protein
LPRTVYFPGSAGTYPTENPSVVEVSTGDVIESVAIVADTGIKYRIAQ